MCIYIYIYMYIHILLDNPMIHRDAILVMALPDSLDICL